MQTVDCSQVSPAADLLSWDSYSMHETEHIHPLLKYLYCSLASFQVSEFFYPTDIA